MKWIKVKIDYFSDELNQTKENLINILSEIGIKQIEVSDFFTDNSLDYNVNFKKQSDVWSMTGYIIDNRFASLKLNIIYEKLSEYSETREDFIYEVYTAKCSDEDWQDEWKKYFHTVNITENIVIKPSWDNYEPIDNEIVIEIDPGLAFGTGTHETTSLCAKFLEKYSAGRKKLLDIGIDEKVEEVVLENFDKNNIKDNFQVIIGNLVEDINEKYDIIVSNILVDVLTELLESIEKTLDKDAIVIFSGILAEKEEAFTEKAEKYKLEKLDRKEKRNWVSLVFKYTK